MLKIPPDLFGLLGHEVSKNVMGMIINVDMNEARPLEVGGHS